MTTYYSDPSETGVFADTATIGTAVTEVNVFRVSTGVLLTVIPHITSIVPSSGPVGTNVTITGTNFYALIGGGAVTLNGTPMSNVSWSDTEIVIEILAGATTGDIVVENDDGEVSNGVEFTVTSLTLISLTPDYGRAGDTVVLVGTLFGAVQGGSTVKFGLLTATVSAWADEEITVTVPAITGDCDVTVVVDAVESNALPFTFFSITSLHPDIGSPGDRMRIKGYAFGAIQGSSKVYFGALEATVDTWSATEIACFVPAITDDCNVKVVT